MIIFPASKEYEHEVSPVTSGDRIITTTFWHVFDDAKQTLLHNQQLKTHRKQNQKLNRAQHENKEHTEKRKQEIIK